MAIKKEELQEVVDLLREAQKGLPPVNPVGWSPSMQVEEALIALEGLTLKLGVQEKSDEAMIEVVEELCESVETLFPKKEARKNPATGRRASPTPPPDQSLIARARRALETLDAQPQPKAKAE